MEHIKDNVKKNIFINVQRGIFAQHKIIFSFMILTNIKILYKEL